MRPPSWRHVPAPRGSRRGFRARGAPPGAPPPPPRGAPAGFPGRGAPGGAPAASLIPERVPVGAALVGEPGDRVHPLIVVLLELVERGVDPPRRPRAERLGDEALL